jgi:hypothetical protein
VKRRGRKVVRNRKGTGKHPRRGRIKLKGENIRIQQSLHISQNILETIAIIATFMATSTKNTRNNIQR